MDIDIENPIILEELQTLTKHDTKLFKRCSSLANDIRVGRFTVVQLVEHLGCLLTDTSTEKREIGTLILSRVLEELPNDFLSCAQLSFITLFYSDRLKDHHQVVPAVLIGLLAIGKCKNIPEGATTQIFSTLFQHVSCQQQQQEDRYNIYKIFELFFAEQRSELNLMQFEFVNGVISAIDGERDPRNLLFLFNWLPTFIRNVSLDHLTEEMFEVMACYFPVDFKVPAQDSNSISRDSLAAALCPCLCCVSSFSEFCLPLALDKFASSLRIAKLDSLAILVEGCKTFSLDSYVQHSTEIWASIQKEVLHCSDPEIEEASLKTLTIVLKKLSESNETFVRILSDITDTLKGNLHSDTKLFVSSTKILLYTAKASKKSVKYITSQILPLLINTYNITETPSHQVQLFNVIMAFTQTYVDVSEDVNFSDVPELNTVPALCLKALVHHTDQVRAAGLNGLAVIAKSFSDDVRLCLYETLCKLLLFPQAEIVRGALLNLFEMMARTYPEEIKTKVLNCIQITDLQSLHLYLEALCEIAPQLEFTKMVLPILLHYSTNDIDSAQVAVANLNNLLCIHETDKNIQNLIHEQGFITKMLEYIFTNLNAIDIDQHRTFLENISSMFTMIIGFQSVDEQCGILAKEFVKLSSVYRSTHNGILIVVYYGVLLRLKKEVLIDLSIIDDIRDAALKLENPFLQDIAVQLLANVINKRVGSDLDLRLKNIFDMSNHLDNFKSVTLTNIISVISWVTKALLMQGHKEADAWTAKLLELLEHNEEAAKGFKIIMNDNYNCLSSNSCCTKRLLYRQKFFTCTCAKLIEHYKEENASYLLAIGYLLQEAPQQVLVLHFNKILRLIVLCLERCGDPEVLSAVLETLCKLIQNKESLIEEHIQEFLPRFLKLSTFKLSMKVRIRALQCIQQYTSGYPLYKLLPHKQNVIYSLELCLDDPKRLVRAEAVEARSRWFLLDAPI